MADNMAEVSEENEEEIEKNKYPCTYLSKMKNENTLFLTKTLHSYDIYKRNKAQKKDMQAIKEIMEKNKVRYFCHLNERTLQAKKIAQKNYRKIMEDNDINIKNSEIKLRLTKKLKEREELKKKRICGQKERMINIVKKLLQEQKRQEQIDEQKNKTYFDIPKRKKIQPVLDETFEDSEIWMDEESDETGDWEELEQLGADSPKSKSQRSVVKNVFSKKGSVTKGSLKKGSLESTRRVSPKSKFKGSIGFQLPPIPHTNPREMITSTSEVDLNLLEQNFEETRNLVKSHELFRMPEAKILQEYGFSWKPKTVVFDKFELEKINWLKITITNNGPETKYCQFSQILTDDDFRSGIIEVEPQMPQRLAAGMSFTANVYFKPEQDFKDLNGDIIFLSWIPDSEEKHQFGIPFNCILPRSKIVIHPKNITFPRTPYWELDRFSKPTTNLEIQNKGNKSCKIIIRKENIEDDFLDVLESFHNLSTLKSESLGDLDKLSDVDEILNACLQNIYSIYSFSSYIVDLGPRSKEIVKIQFKNPSFIGLHLEKYSLIVLENKGTEWENTDQLTILIQTEVVGNFIKLEKETLDFNICVFDSAYQETFKVKNEETFPVNITFRLPSRIKECIFIFPPNASLRSREEVVFSIKFIPRKELLASIFFHPVSNILDFPIKIDVISPKNNVPPTVLNTFAILTSNEVFIRPFPETPFLEDNGKIIIDLGQVSTHETVLCDLEIENFSSEEQEFGFLNLPEFVILYPNFGFGILQPGELRKLTLHCSPSLRDKPTKYGKRGCEDDPTKLCFQIKCSTVSALGGLTETEVKKFQRRKSKKESQIPRHSNLEVKSLLLPSIQTEDEIFPEVCLEGDELVNLESFTELMEEEISEEKKIKTQTINFILEVKDNWCEFSHQYIEFPDTPMGSFTLSSTNLNAFNQSSIDECVCGYLNGKRVTNFQCKFEFFGGSDEIMVEPTCGTLNFGETRKIILIAKPKVDEDILEEKAEIYKVFRIQKEKEEEESKKKAKSKKAEKEKKSDAKEKDLRNVYKNYQIANKDLYNAEKELWRCHQPNEISAKFTCYITFPYLEQKEPEFLYIEAKCLVIKPDFILHTDTQVLDFGQILIGVEKKLSFQIENISEKEIVPKVSFINPVGPFECFLPKINLEREHILTVPVTMKPLSEQYYQENLDIQCENTKITISLKGEGVQLDYEMKPSFVVCRLETNLGSKVDCSFQIINKCRALMDLKIKKLFELEGTFVTVPKEEAPRLSVTKNKKEKPKKEPKVKKMSNDLTENEYYSLDNDHFMKFDNEPKFLLTTEENLKIEPFGKGVVKIKFELPKKLENQNNDFVSKYEIWLNQTTLLHDFFIIEQQKK